MASLKGGDCSYICEIRQCIWIRRAIYIYLLFRLRHDSKVRRNAASLACCRPFRRPSLRVCGSFSPVALPRPRPRVLFPVRPPPPPSRPFPMTPWRMRDPAGLPCLFSSPRRVPRSAPVPRRSHLMPSRFTTCRGALGAGLVHRVGAPPVALWSVIWGRFSSLPRLLAAPSSQRMPSPRPGPPRPSSARRYSLRGCRGLPGLARLARPAAPSRRPPIDLPLHRSPPPESSNSSPSPPPPPVPPPLASRPRRAAAFARSAPPGAARPPAPLLNRLLTNPSLTWRRCITPPAALAVSAPAPVPCRPPPSPPLPPRAFAAPALLPPPPAPSPSPPASARPRPQARPRPAAAAPVQPLSLRVGVGGQLEHAYRHAGVQAARLGAVW